MARSNNKVGLLIALIAWGEGKRMLGDGNSYAGGYEDSAVDGDLEEDEMDGKHFDTPQRMSAIQRTNSWICSHQLSDESYPSEV